MRPKIWVDCDGVLCDFVAAYLYQLNFYLGPDDVPFAHADVTSWDLVSLSDKDSDAHIKKRLVGNSHIALLPDIEGSVAGLARLRELGDVACATAPMYLDTFIMQRSAWLRQRGFTSRTIAFITDKSWLMGDVLIDDRAENCIEWQARNPHGLAILFDQPWNRDTDTLVRACGWPATVGYVERWVSVFNAVWAPV